MMQVPPKWRYIYIRLQGVTPEEKIFPRIPHKIEKCFQHCTAEPDNICMSLYEEFLTKCLSNSRSEFIDDFTYTFNELKFTQIRL
jgi:hypothetical protein